MKKETCRHFFAGGNTVSGFHSLFDYIADLEQCNWRLIIKGGPGTGKSTLMKKIGALMAERGFYTELFFCSSDNESLDGLSVPSLGLVMVDGTAPHTIDASLPGARDEIINLGDCWDTEALRRHRREIAELIRQNSGLFVQAYQYLKEASVVLEKTRYLMAEAIDYAGLSKMTNGLLTETVAALPPAEGVPHERRLFAGAISPQGLVNFYPSILQDISSFYLLTGDAGAGKSFLLDQIRHTALQAGHSVEVYHCAFDPRRIDAVVIPASKTAFLKATYPHSFTVSPAKAVHTQTTVALSRCARVHVLRNTAAERAECHDRFWPLVGKAVEMLRRAKRIHDQLEAYYIQAMDFDEVAQKQAAIISKVLCSTTPERSVLAQK
ncbi:MAG: hypothetical protein M1571_09600 [Firmicutes bacterium]|nr:hypothetical protein [Bacillota bacterium]